MRTLLLSFVFLFVAFQNVIAYPISPRPLRKMIIESEYIVVADVLDIEDGIEGDNWYSTRAVLCVKSFLKGNITEETIHVYFAPGMICPAPARYQVGTQVMAFLNAREEMEGFTTHALSYGSKMMNEESLIVYKQCVKEMQAILEVKDENRKNELTLDWLIKCAKNKYTRWEGTYELSPRSDFMSSYDQDTETFTRKFELNESQLRELRTLVLDLTEIDYQDIGLIDLVIRKGDREVLDVLVNYLKSAELSEIWHKVFLMQRVAVLSENKDLMAILEQIDEVGFDSDRDEKIDKLSQEFVKKL